MQVKTAEQLHKILGMYQRYLHGTVMQVFALKQ